MASLRRGWRFQYTFGSAFFMRASTALDWNNPGSRNRVEQSKVNPNQQYYPNGLADLLGVEQLKL